MPKTIKNVELLEIMKLEKGKRKNTRNVKQRIVPKGVSELVEIHDKYWEVVRGCNRVVDVILHAGKGVKEFLPNSQDFQILCKGMVRPDEWWRIVKDGNGNPLMEVAAWDGAEPDSNCNCYLRFPMQWLYMSDDELNDLFNMEVQ